MRLRIIIFLWLGALVCSTGYRWYRGSAAEPMADQLVCAVAVPEAIAEDGVVDLAYRDINSQESARAPVLLLHGNPVAGRAMLPLAHAMGAKRRLLIPDLPGLGTSDLDVSAYSAELQVTVLLAWLDELGLGTVHVAGYSQGSVVALELADRAPDRVASVALIAGVGLQAYELLGRYEWNQPLYTAYHGFLWSLRWLTPHFGLLDAPFFSPTTAQNFADTDLRRNEGILDRLNGPVLLLHSLTDRMVPFAAAQAHAQRLPQAVFYELPGGHLGIFKEPNRYAISLQRFLEDVESGQAPTRALAVTAGRMNQPALAIELPQRPSTFQNVLLASLLFVLVFFSEDLACIVGGILAASGALSLSASILGCFVGIFVSDIGLYVIGRILGDRAFKLPFIAKASVGDSFTGLRARYQRKGLQIVFLTRFIPGSRVLAYTTAGILKLPLPRFSLWLALAAALWTPILVSLAYGLGRPLIGWWERSGVVVLPLVAIGLVLLYLGLHLLTQSMTYRGRRAIRGRWIRLTQWEFWPALPVYLPVFFYGCFLAIRYRSATVWAACNPGMSPASGLAMESKSEILAALNAETGSVAKWACLECAADVELRWNALTSFLSRAGLDWPIVLKPDIGQRGEGVAVIHSVEQAKAYLSENQERVIAQEYISGEEFGVFYIREPGGESRLFSITEKVLPELTGDGVRTLERLILDDARAVALAKHYLQVNRERLADVPQAGERVQLVELGTHCRGAVFLDGNRYQSDALLAAMDRVLATYEGFYFGRFDVRVPQGGAALAAGEGIRILELNGVSSESTDIYDPKNSIFHAWGVLCRQWGLAFRIGAANRANGAEVPTIGAIIRVLRGHHQRSPYEASFGIKGEQNA